MECTNQKRKRSSPVYEVAHTTCLKGRWIKPWEFLLPLRHLLIASYSTIFLFLLCEELKRNQVKRSHEIPQHPATFLLGTSELRLRFHWPHRYSILTFPSSTHVVPLNLRTHHTNKPGSTKTSGTWMTSPTAPPSPTSAPTTTWPTSPGSSPPTSKIPSPPSPCVGIQPIHGQHFYY